MNLATSWDAKSEAAPRGFSASPFGLEAWSGLYACKFMLPSELNAIPGAGQCGGSWAAWRKLLTLEACQLFQKDQGSGQNFSPHGLQTLALLSWLCDISHGKRDFIVVIKVTDLLRPREGDYAGLSRWVQQSHRSLKQKRKESDVKHRNDLMCRWLEDGGNHKRWKHSAPHS